MLPYSDRFSLDSARALLIGVSLVSTSSCGETEYNVGSGSSSTASGATNVQSGGANAQSGGTSAGSAINYAGSSENNTVAPVGGAGLGSTGNIGSAGVAGRSIGASAGGTNSTIEGGAGNGAAGDGALEGFGGNIATIGTGGSTTGGALGSGGFGGASSESPAGSASVAVSGGGLGRGGSADLAGNAGRSAASKGGAGGTVAGAAGSIGSWPCGIEPNPDGNRNKRKMVLRDEGAAKLGFIDVGNAKNSWVVTLEREASTGIQGRDLQLIGNCRVLVGTDLGYEEYAIEDGKKVAEIATYSGTIAAHRLRNRNTQLVGVGTTATPYQSSVGIVLLEVNAAGAVVSKVVYPGGTYARLVRQTPTGTFLVTSNTKVFEGDATGAVLSPTLTVGTASTTHAWKALRIAGAAAGTTETVVATGYVANLTIFRADGTVRRTITGGSASIVGGASAVNPYFFAEVQVLANGNFVVANWRGHGTNNFLTGIPVLEYTPSGALAWYWGDPAYADRLSSIQGVIVLDGLDPTKLHVEDTNGQQVPVD